MKAASVLLLAVVFAPSAFAMACGDGTLAEPAPCVTPTALPTSTPGVSQNQAYFRAQRNYLERLTKLRSEELAKRPTRSFSKDPNFREEFAAFADASICAATAFRDLPLPAGDPSRFGQLKGAVDAFIAHIEFGREAVRKRNVTEYHDWFDQVEAKLAAVIAAAQVPPIGR